MSYICKIADEEEMNEKWDYEIKHASHSKENWIQWKKEFIENQKEGKQIPYYGILDGKIICEATASIDSSVVQNGDGLVSNCIAYLNGFRTIKGYQGKGYFSKLFWFMIQDLKQKGYQFVTLGVEPNEIKNMMIYFHYGFSEYLKSGMEFYPNGEEAFVLYYKKNLQDELFYLEEASIQRRDDVVEYMREHQRCHSSIHGSGSLDKILEGITYEECLEKIIKTKDFAYAKSIGRCPGMTYFLIRKNDNKLIGMINIRHHLSEDMLEHAGHIGYGIRPSERRKGYNKINLYLGLGKAKEMGLDSVELICDAGNNGSNKTIQALGGVLESSRVENDVLENVYWIDVSKSLDEYRDIYQDKIYQKK